MIKPLVVGYKGEIGSFILAGLLRIMPRANEIYCVDINDSHYQVKKRILAANHIFLCVPMEETIPWLNKYKLYLKNKVVIEQTSLKSWAFNLNLKKEFPKVTFIHMHILFRPSETKTEDRAVLLVHQIWKGFQQIHWLLQDIVGTKIQLCQSIAIHDKYMAYHQALVHKVIVRLADQIKYLPHKTYISSKICELSDRIMRGGKLIKQLQMNPDASEAMKSFKDSLLTTPIF